MTPGLTPGVTPESPSGLKEAAVEAVREASGQGRLATIEDLLAALEADGAFLSPVGLSPVGLAPADMEAKGPCEDLPVLLAAALADAPEVACFQGLSGVMLYHTPELLSHTYARILDRKGSPLLLMAGEIRANSRDYPRPLPVELFQAPPFDLTPEEIGQALQGMAGDPKFHDISSTTTPGGAVFLFSTRHLEPGYALFLAQRAESLTENP
jgi:hypothetical protein